MLKTANYRVSVSIGSGKEGEQFMELCNLLAEKLNLRNVKGDPNYSALLRRGVESLAKELGVKP